MYTMNLDNSPLAARQAENLVYYEDVKDLSFSNQKLKKPSNLTLIAEEESNLNFTKTVMVPIEESKVVDNKAKEGLLLIDKEDIMRQIEEQSEARLKTFNKYRQYKDLASNFIFSNWNITNFKTKFRNAYNSEK